MERRALSITVILSSTIILALAVAMVLLVSTPTADAQQEQPAMYWIGRYDLGSGVTTRIHWFEQGDVECYVVASNVYAGTSSAISCLRKAS